MKNALERMDELITYTLIPVDNLSAEQANCQIVKALAEKDNIRKELMHPPLNLQTIQAWELHIRHYQCVLTYLADLVSASREQDIVAISGEQYKELLYLLFDLLTVIQRRFGNYLNRDDKMPMALQQVKRNILQNKLQRFTAIFNSEINDPLLFAAVIKPITSFLKAEIHEAFSYARTDYLYHYLSALSSLPLNSETPEMELISILVRVNCNSETLKKYIIEKMKAGLQNCRTGKLVRENLESWQDFFRDIPVRSTRGWNKDAVSLKDELLVWIEGRLKQQAGKPDSQSGKRIQLTEQTNEQGLFFMMTMEELALLIRIEKESGYLINRNITEMMREIALIIHTTKQHDVSWQNFYNCYYSIDQSTIKSLGEKLFVMGRTLHQLEVKLKRKGLKGKE